MNMSTLCSIKYMNRSYFSKARYMIGVGFKILGRTPVPKLPPSYPPRQAYTDADFSAIDYSLLRGFFSGRYPLPLGD